MMNDDEDKMTKTLEQLNSYGAQLHIADVENIEIIQLGESEDDNGNASKWLKAKFKSGNTYLFTDESYVQLMLNTAKAAAEADRNKLADDVSGAVERWLKAENQQKLLDEAEETDVDVKQAVKQRSLDSQTAVTIKDLDLTDEQIAEKAKSFFKKFIDSVYIDDKTPSLPVEWTTQFSEMLLSIRKPDGTYAKNVAPTNDCVETQIVINKLPAAFWKSGYAVNAKMNEWQLAFSPIAWSGIKCNNEPSNLEELNDSKSKISNLESITAKVADEVAKDDEADEQAEVSSDDEEL